MFDQDHMHKAPTVSKRVAHQSRRVPLDHALLRTARQIGVSLGEG